MSVWATVWAVVWFGGLTLFAILTVVITWQGARDLRALLSGLEKEKGSENGSSAS